MTHVPTSDRTGVTREPSSWAVGWILFAAVMMVMIGIFHAIAGLVAIFDDEFYAVGSEYVFQFDTTTWGWTHLILGIVIAIAGVGLLSGNILARTVGIVLAGLSALAAFAWIPYYPFWGIVLVVLAVSVIWALTVHGRDVTLD
jgi:hypothetical protein